MTSIKDRIGLLANGRAPVQATEPAGATARSRVAALAGVAGSVAVAAAKPAYTHYDDGICPQCGPNSRMEKYWLDDREQVYFCPVHRIAMPVPVEQQNA